MTRLGLHISGICIAGNPALIFASFERTTEERAEDLRWANAE